MARPTKTVQTQPDTQPMPEQVQRAPIEFGGARPSESVIPDFTTVTEAAPLPRVDARPEFVLLWNVTVWQVMAGRLVPALRQMRLISGVSNVKVGGGRVSIDMARANWESRGWRMIPHSEGPGGSYMRVSDVDPSGQGRTRRKHYHTAWETLYSGSDRVVTDEPAYAAWCAGLVARGIIPPCPLPQAAGLRERMVGKIAALQERRGRGATALTPQIEAMEADLRVVEDYLRTLDRTPVPARSMPAGIDLEAHHG